MSCVFLVTLRVNSYVSSNELLIIQNTGKDMKIYVYPHKILSTKSRPVKEIDGKLQTLIDDMIELMYKAKGVGLAANQVGEAIRLF